MKIIQKITLVLFTLTGFSSLSSAVLELDTTAGDAEMAGQITGAAKKISANQLTISNAANEDSLTSFEIAAGAIYCSVDGALGNAVTGSVVMNGGSLETAPAVTIVPPLVMTLRGTLTAGGAGVLAGISGPSKLTVAGIGAITPADLHAASNTVDVSGIVHVGATGSLLPAGAVTVKNAALVKLRGVVKDCVPGAMEVESGGTLEVDASLIVPRVGAAGSGDLFGTLKFNVGAILMLGNASNWARAITVGTPS